MESHRWCARSPWYEARLLEHNVCVAVVRLVVGALDVAPGTSSPGAPQLRSKITC